MIDANIGMKIIRLISAVYLRKEISANFEYDCLQMIVYGHPYHSYGP